MAGVPGRGFFLGEGMSCYDSSYLGEFFFFFFVCLFCFVFCFLFFRSIRDRYKI